MGDEVERAGVRLYLLGRRLRRGVVVARPQGGAAEQGVRPRRGAGHVCVAGGGVAVAMPAGPAAPPAQTPQPRARE
eukprot:2669674-Lingulodinium_polyedra.AAC.1